MKAEFLILFLYWNLTYVVTQQPSTYVMQMGSKYTTQSRWLATFVIHLEPHKQHLMQLESTIEDLGNAIEHYINTLSDDDVTTWQFKTRQHQLENVQTQITQLKNELTEIDDIIKNSEISRDKRALFSFLGNILSTITGTATEADIQKINSHLIQLNDANMEIKHVLDDSLTIVNATRIKTNELSETVNHLISGMSLIFDQFDNITAVAAVELKKQKFMKRVYIQISYSFHTINKGLILLRQDIDSFKLKFSDVLNHKVTPTLLPPKQLKSLLQEVSSQLETVELPYDIDKHLLQYYSELSSHMFHASDGLGIVISIPLVSRQSLIFLYKIVMYPIPYANGKMQLRHEIDHTYFAVTPDKTKIAFLTEHEFTLCNKDNTVLCHIDSPFRSVSLINASCAVTLLLTSRLTHCPIVIQQNDLILPHATLLDTGKWAIIHTQQLQFTIFCNSLKSQTVITTQVPFDVIQLPLNCYATSLSMTLPPTYYRTSKINFHPILDFQNNVTILDFVPPAIHHAARTVPNLVDKLVDGPISLAELQRRLHAIHDVPITTNNLRKYWIPMAVLLIFIIVTLTIAILWFRCRNRLQMLRFAAQPAVDSVVPIPSPPSPVVNEHSPVEMDPPSAGPLTLKSIQENYVKSVKL